MKKLAKEAVTVFYLFIYFLFYLFKINKRELWSSSFDKILQHSYVSPNL